MWDTCAVAICGHSQTLFGVRLGTSRGLLGSYYTASRVTDMCPVFFVQFDTLYGKKAAALYTQVCTDAIFASFLDSQATQALA